MVSNLPSKRLLKITVRRLSTPGGGLASLPLPLMTVGVLLERPEAELALPAEKYIRGSRERIRVILGIHVARTRGRKTLSLWQGESGARRNTETAFDEGNDHRCQVEVPLKR